MMVKHILDERCYADFISTSICNMLMPFHSYFQSGVSNFLLGRYDAALVNFEDAMAYLRMNQNMYAFVSFLIEIDIYRLNFGLPQQL